MNKSEGLSEVKNLKLSVGKVARSLEAAAKKLNYTFEVKSFTSIDDEDKKLIKFDDITIYEFDRTEEIIYNKHNAQTIYNNALDKVNSLIFKGEIKTGAPVKSRQKVLVTSGDRINQKGIVISISKKTNEAEVQTNNEIVNIKINDLIVIG